ncbi:uncharacterized protein LOC136088423 [Hydra vulgaris]|uniref:Uncharacterized protein LOC136088423 n=1 Tax=Hydra vulgaris TaxID=6087 RepID=A0ABM4D1R8_HYDVU
MLANLGSDHSCQKCKFLPSEGICNVIDNLPALCDSLTVDIKMSLVYIAGYVIREDENPDDTFYFYEWTYIEEIQECNTLEKESILKKSEGPYTQQIEVILQQLKVQRQAYHGKSFIGNHKKCILRLCNSVPICVYNNGFAGTSLHERSVEAGNKYKQLFHKFANCYNVFSSKSSITAVQLTQLETHIADLMQFYRANWLDDSVPPKLHSLEEHAIPFLKKWGAGFGYYGEQGGESIHHDFNKLFTIYQSIPSPTKRLSSIIKSHHQKTNPINRKHKPTLRKRKKERNLIILMNITIIKC